MLIWTMGIASSFSQFSIADFGLRSLISNQKIPQSAFRIPQLATV
jgi:hypothetical protein